MPRAQRAVAMQEQRRHAHELLDLGERLLVLLVAVVLRRGGGEPGDVGQRLAAFVRQRRVLAGGQAERAEEATAPFEQRAAALGQPGIVVGQQQREFETLVLELRGAGLGHAVERAAFDDRGQLRIDQQLAEPVGAVPAAAGEPSAQRATQFRRVHAQPEAAAGVVDLAQGGECRGQGRDPGSGGPSVATPPPPSRTLHACIWITLRRAAGRRQRAFVLTDHADLLLLGFIVLVLALVAALAILMALRRRSERAYVAKLRDREEQLKLALWATGEHYWDYDLASGKLRRFQPDDETTRPDGLARLSGPVEVDQVLHPDDLPLAQDNLRRYLEGATPMFRSEHRVLDNLGQWVWIRARGRAVSRDAAGNVVRLAGTALNITNDRHVERERRIASAVLRNMNEAVAVHDHDFGFVSVNPAFTRMTGYGDEEIAGRGADLLDSPQHDPAFYRHVREIAARQGRFSGEMWQRRKDGEEFLCAIETSVVQEAEGEPPLYVAVLTDITQQKRAEQELRYLANFDTLTNLPNRTLLSERLSRAIVRARRENNRVAVLFLDLDRFKDINDSLGHAAGDRILRSAAVRLQQTVGQHHTVARLSGDEFTVVLENLESLADADKVAREIIMAFEAPLIIDERQEISISPSIGISVYPDHGQVPTELLKQADTAMYQAKAAGRRTFARYDDAMDVSVRQRATSSGALRKVIDRGELHLAYQPRLALQSSRITGVEALLRWTSEEHGEIPPSEFIPLAEESGQILEIGEWVLDRKSTRLNSSH